ncbi:MAG: hypothetical protein H7A51_18820 [Akkermansiaceae bacterium]|nr:hypothetical protein [Akkermansiaceae bacterium]
MAPLKRQSIDLSTFENLIEGSEIIVTHKRWPKVIRKGAVYTKFFSYDNKGIRRRHLNPVATEFVRNAERITALGINTIRPDFWARCPEAECDVVSYESVPGRTVYNAYQSDQDPGLLTKLAKYIAELHGKNFYFRHGHSDNYLIQDDGSFAIIDMDNVRYSMNRRRKAKNLFYLLDHAVRNDRDLYQRYGVANFLEAYFTSASTPAADREFILGNLRKRGLVIN